MLSAIALAGCATEHKTTTKSVSNGVTNTVTDYRNRTDPLLTKQVIQEDTFLGIDLNVLGTSSMAPAKFRMGFGRQRYLSNPTAIGKKINAAPISTANYGNVGWFNQTANENTTTGVGTNGLPTIAYEQPQISTANPLLATPATTPTVTTNTP